MTTVLITTAIAPPDNMPYLAMTDRATRLLTTKAGIFFWAAFGVKNIVIVDATNRNVLSEEEVQLLNEMNVNIEQLAFQQDDELIKIKGKGYAEGSLILHAVENSEVLAKTKEFYKCTGKVYCRNFPQIQEAIKRQGLSTVFWMESAHGPNPTKIDTRFFYTTAAFFKDVLVHGYMSASDTEKNFVESSCAQVVEAQCKNGELLRPLLSGFSGGLGRQYDEIYLGDLDAAFPCWFQKKNLVQKAIDKTLSFKALQK